MGSVPAALVSLGAVAAHAVVSQLAPDWAPFQWTSFGLSVAAILVNLAAATWLRMLERRWSLGWMLVHVGLLLAIASALLGAKVARRGKLVLHAGQAQAMVVDAQGKHLDYLPFGLLLQDFVLEESTPPLTLVDSAAREIVFQKGEPVVELVAGARGKLRGIEFEVLRSLAHAELEADTVRLSADSLCPPAAWIRYRVEHGPVQQGWITCGGIGIPTITQPAGAVRLAMAMPPAKAFKSIVTLIKVGEKPEEVVIEVNHGLNRDGWTLQQLDYDKRAGRASQISILEAVRDPLAPWVKAGILLTLLGLVAYAAAEWRKQP